MSLSLTPAYNLKAVLKETGVSADVLRAWERRYGIPMPQRTSGGHRLYSEHDIEMIKWLIARQTEGLSISRAVDMWKEHATQGRDPLLDTQQARQPGLINLTQTMPAVYLPPETGIDAMRSHWLAACMNFNEIGAEQALNQAFALYPVETVCIEVLQRGMVEIGSLWYENRASVQQEHFASALAMRRLDSLIAASPAPTRPYTIIVGCPAEEWHAFTPLLLSLLLRRRGLNIIYLGANVPPDHFVETVDAVRASLVILASQQLNTAASLQQSAARLAQREVPVAFGGRIFALHPELLLRISGSYLGDRLDSALDRVETLLATHPAPAPALLPTPEYELALQAFIARRAFVETAINEQVRQHGGNGAYLTVAHKFMGDNIVAALQLGEIKTLDSEIDWLDVLLESQRVSRSAVYDYLASYVAALSLQVGAPAGPVSAWLEQCLRTRRA